MPRKAKEKATENVVENSETEVKKTSVKKVSSTKKDTASVKKKSVSKKAETKAAEKTPAKKKSTTKKTETKTAEKTPAKKKSTTKKAETKVTEKAPAKKKSTTKKAETKVAEKAPAKKKSTTKKAETKTAEKAPAKKKATTRKKSSPVPQILEYYDLPYKYGNTVVKLLAQTPKTLFVYWEISDTDIEIYKKQFGDDFFAKTQPILIVHNITKNKTYNVEINDFANCWYLNTEDTDCEYDIELARIFINSDKKSKNKNINYLSIAKSNDLISPNDHILFEKLGEFVTFKNIETDQRINKNVKSFTFLNDLYKFYKDMYNDELLKNPSSNFLI